MKIIAFEGADFSGKTTQSVMLQHRLELEGVNVKRVKVPVNDGVLFKLIYRMLKTGSAKKYPYLFQFIQFLNKLFWQTFVYPFLCIKYDVLVLDRWALSSLIYGSAEGLASGYSLFLFNRLFTPDVTVIFHGTEHSRDEDQDVYEKDAEMQRVVKELYTYADVLNDFTTIFVKNDGSKLEVHETIVEKLKQHKMYPQGKNEV